MITAAFMPARDNTTMASHFADAEDADDAAEVTSGRDRGAHHAAIDVSARDDGRVAAMGIARLAEVGSAANRSLVGRWAWVTMFPLRTAARANRPLPVAAREDERALRIAPEAHC